MRHGILEIDSKLTCSIQGTYIQTWHGQIEFRVLFTNDISFFTNENLYVKSKFKNPADRHQHSID